MYENGDCLIEKYLGRDAKPDVCKEYDCERESNGKEKKDKNDC
jgi:hypothetical protein